jgi:molybdenum cofactor synthesis domain-containing protein
VDRAFPAPAQAVEVSAGPRTLPDRGSARRIAVVTVSDRSFRGERPDASGPEAERIVSEWGHTVVERHLVPDERDRLAALLAALCDGGAVDVVLTTGGTGFAPRDVTPEATAQVVERRTPGLDELMRREGMAKTQLAVLSRGMSGIRARTLVVNLPGNPKGVRESLAAIRAVFAHAVEILRGENLDHSGGSAT